MRVRRIRLNFLAELTDEDVQVFGLLDVVTAPDGPQQNAMREHFAGMADEVHQQVVLLRRQMHLLTPHSDAAGVQVDVKVAGLKQGGDASRHRERPPQGRPHPREQFRHPEGFGPIVIGAGIEGFDLNPLFALDGQHNNRHWGDGTEAAAEFKPADMRHGEIRDDEVRHPVPEEVERLLPISRHLHLVAACRQTTP